MWDPKVCRPFVSGICPHDLFTNTVSRFRYSYSPPDKRLTSSRALLLPSPLRKWI